MAPPADIVEATAKAEAHPAAPLHIVAPWLEVLLWLADARWRKLGAAAPVEQVQQLLDCLQGYVALLWTAAPSTPGSHDQGDHLFSIQAGNSAVSVARTVLRMPVES